MLRFHTPCPQYRVEERRRELDRQDHVRSRQAAARAASQVGGPTYGQSRKLVWQVWCDVKLCVM
jgi:hypothetical protein